VIGALGDREVAELGNVGKTPALCSRSESDSSAAAPEGATDFSALGPVSDCWTFIEERSFKMVKVLSSAAMLVKDTIVLWVAAAVACAAERVEVCFHSRSCFLDLVGGDAKVCRLVELLRFSAFSLLLESFI
jgi:hypothetical protein